MLLKREEAGLCCARWTPYALYSVFAGERRRVFTGRNSLFSGIERIMVRFTDVV